MNAFLKQRSLFSAIFLAAAFFLTSAISPPVAHANHHKSSEMKDDMMKKGKMMEDDMMEKEKMMKDDMMKKEEMMKDDMMKKEEMMMKDKMKK